MSEHLRLSGLYWCLTSLDIMGKADESDKDLIISVIEEAKNEDGGYGAAKNHKSHILHTLCAVQVLITLKRTDLIDVDSVVKFVKGLQQEDGSFNGMPQGLLFININLYSTVLEIRNLFQDYSVGTSVF